MLKLYFNIVHCVFFFIDISGTVDSLINILRVEPKELAA